MRMCAEREGRAGRADKRNCDRNPGKSPRLFRRVRSVLSGDRGGELSDAASASLRSLPLSKSPPKPAPLFTRLARLVVFFAAVQILGGHWLALQSVAWVGMLANYARGETLVTAIEKILDGEHPCDLCEVVKSGRADEQKRQVMKVVVKVDAVLGTVLRLPLPQGAEWKYSAGVPALAARSLEPPEPPPQAA